MSAAGSGAPAPAAPEGVVILGMHRSGTSLITRLVNLLGVNVCRYGDLLVGRARNPRGHWESKSLVHYNDRLLEELGGSWFCPPEMTAAQTRRLLEHHRDEALAAVGEAHPERPWVWKDPRTCALMPFWAAVLEGRVAYVLAVRHPFEVSDSLHTRNGCKPLLSLAMWERYTRQAMLGAAGSPAMTCTYDGVLAEPVAWCERLAAFLGELGVPTRPVDRLAIEAFVMSELRHSSQSWDALRPGPEISEQQVALARAASTYTVARVYAPPRLPAETPQTSAIFREIAAIDPGRRGLAALPERFVAPGATGRSSREDSWPAVSAVLGCREPQALAGALEALGSLPAGSELFAPGAALAGAHEWCERHEVKLREIEGERAPTPAAALEAGGKAAGGRLVLLAGAGLTRTAGWFLPLRQILASGEVGGAAPTMRFESAAGEGFHGRAFADEDLGVRYSPAHAADGPVSVPLLPGVHSLFIRRVYAAAGGLDGEFASLGGALAELSVRLWRMGFRCSVSPRAEAWAPAPGAEEAREEVERLHERLRIATLHLGRAQLDAFVERARELPAYEQAARRLAASDTERRRASIEAVCALSIDWYFESFPPGQAGPVKTPAAVQRAKVGTLRRIRRRARRL
ncbi:MAG TPA: hypothetical protein VGY13_14500 [Solirubrobacteraceae bacterium]|jgi:hypothetical protein|nr:hypothetical protein [Solirubrobacteraceae bacterium]